MRREIKFRAWHKADKRYTDYFRLQGIKDDYWDNNTAAYEFEQYTGLIDRDGTPIYEGDIVEHGDELDSGIGQVVWNKQWACFELECAHDYGDTHTTNEIDMAHIEWRVIGNVHEHPHLLNQPKAA